MTRLKTDYIVVLILEILKIISKKKILEILLKHIPFFYAE